jgi:hypothetical protein
LDPFERIVKSYGLLPKMPAHRLMVLELLAQRERRRMDRPVPAPKKEEPVAPERRPYNRSEWNTLQYDPTREDYFPLPKKPKSKPPKLSLAQSLVIGEGTLAGKRIVVRYAPSRKRK